MKTLAKKAFRESTNEYLTALITPVMNQSGCDTWREFTEYLDNVNASPYGAAAGFSGFIYYSETVEFWRKNRKKITRLMTDEAESLGESSALSMVQQFNGLKNYEADEIARALYGRYDEDLTQIYNVFAWYVLEELANAWENFKYENQE